MRWALAPAHRKNLIKIVFPQPLQSCRFRLLARGLQPCKLRSLFTILLRKNTCADRHRLTNHPLLYSLPRTKLLLFGGTMAEETGQTTLTILSRRTFTRGAALTMAAAALPVDLLSQTQSPPATTTTEK